MDKTYFHKNNYNETFSVYKLPLLFLFCFFILPLNYKVRPSEKTGLLKVVPEPN